MNERSDPGAKRPAMIKPVSELDQTRFHQIDLFSAEVKEDPIGFFGPLVKRSPFYSMVGGIPAAIVTRYAHFEKVFANAAGASSRLTTSVIMARGST